MTHAIIRLEETDSTNSFLRSLSPRPAAEVVVAVADYQSAGRGQGSNSWESSRGENLLASISVCPKGIKATQQFCLSVAGALAVKDVLDAFVDDVSLKWPNDVYVSDRKISGTLIETRLVGDEIRECIFGVGININQQEFHSDAPNPVSLRNILGHSVDVESVLQSLILAFENRYTALLNGEKERQMSEYRASQYRRSGIFEYEDRSGRFMAEYVSVADNGILTLRDDRGKERKYAFKEVKYVINRSV